MTNGLKYSCIFLLVVLGTVSCERKSTEQESIYANLKAGVNDIDVSYESTIREVVIHLPDEISQTAGQPVVFAFHGSGRNRRDWIKFFAEDIDREGIIGVYPQGIRHAWNVALGDSEPHDVAFCEMLLDSLSAEFNIDQKRVYAVGWSLGGIFTLKLGRFSNRFAAIACLSGTFYADPKFPDKATLPSLLIVHGRADPLIPFDGGMADHGIMYEPVLETAGAWAAKLSCGSGPTLNLPGDNIEIYNFPACPSNKEVEVIIYNDCGHHLPWEVKNLDRIVLKFLLSKR